LKAISRAIDRFCLKNRRFGIPRLMMYIVLISGVVYIIDQMDTTGMLTYFLAFQPGLIMRGEVWRLITWLFIPLDNNIILEAIVLYFYFFIGSTLEREWGTSKFTVYYILGVLINIIYGFVVWILLNMPGSGMSLQLILFSLTGITPTYLNFSLFFAFAVLFPDQQIRLYFVIPIKIKWVALINAGFFAYSIITSTIQGLYAAALLPIVSLLNFFLVCGYDLICMLRPVAARSSPQAINFKKAAKKASREYDDRHYHHKCAVCGKTDADNPELEFRYCSRCNGYHCFCIEHINNHIHFQ